MALQEWLKNVNEGHVFVCFCLFWWILLVAARADHLLLLPYWAIFIPLWLWNLTVLFGWLTGIIVWIRLRRATMDLVVDRCCCDTTLPHIQAMTVSTFFTLLLSCSEILLCLHLSDPTVHLSYLVILTPLLLVGVLGILSFFFVMIDFRSLFAWTQRSREGNPFRLRSSAGQEHPTEFYATVISIRPRHTCYFTLELCIAVNLLQLIFLISRLDNWIRSKWVVTFIPTFILLGVSFLICVIGFVIALIRYFTAFFDPLYQRFLIRHYSSRIFINFLLFLSVVFLSLRLDNLLSSTQISVSLICAPVLMALIIHSVNSFYAGPGNPWWFGLNRNVFLAIFEACPALQLCANTSVSPSEFWKCTGNEGSRNEVYSDTDQVNEDAATESVSELIHPVGIVFPSSLTVDSSIAQNCQPNNRTSIVAQQPTAASCLSNDRASSTVLTQNRCTQPALIIQGTEPGSVNACPHSESVRLPD